MSLEAHLSEKPADAVASLRSYEADGKGGAIVRFDAPPWGSRTAREIRVGISRVLELSMFQRGGSIASADFACAAEHPLLLDYGPRASIFGQAPLPDPYRFFLEFQKLIRDDLGIAREPLLYLNWQRRMVPWLAMIYSRSFNLLTGPRVVAERAGELLAAQSAEYIILDDSPLEGGEGAQALLLGDFWIIGTGLLLESEPKT